MQLPTWKYSPHQEIEVCDQPYTVIPVPVFATKLRSTGQDLFALLLRIDNYSSLHVRMNPYMSKKSLQITLQPQVLQWARERARLDKETLARKLSVKTETIQTWERSGEISLAQVDRLAHFTHTPLGFLYLSEPVRNEVSIPDFRTVGDATRQYHSPDLIETIQTMQRRQDWLRDELIEQGRNPITLVGSITTEMEPKQAANILKENLQLPTDWAESLASWTEALRYLKEAIEQAGIIVAINGIVGNNTHRKLDPSEFRGFTLVDSYAPLIFINGADAKAAQMFTLIHELAHIGITASGISNFETLQPIPIPIEIFCNQVAAEFLVPAEALQDSWHRLLSQPVNYQPYQLLARQFKVSNIVIARRALDLGLINRSMFFAFYQSQMEIKSTKKTGGGDFWKTQNVRIGKAFGMAVIQAVKEGRLLYREAYALTGLADKSFEQFVQKMGA